MPQSLFDLLSHIHDVTKLNELLIFEKLLNDTLVGNHEALIISLDQSSINGNFVLLLLTSLGLLSQVSELL